MIMAFHCIFSAYGFWLPNEPRGSWSDFVASWDLFRYGKPNRVYTRRSIAHQPYDRALKRQMQSALSHPPVRLTGRQALVVARAIGASGYPLHALAVMPNHVHAVVGHTPRDVRRVVGHLKSDATRALRAQGWFREQRPWCDHGWNVFLDSDEDVHRAIRYVQENPMRDGLKPQRWSFVTPYGVER